MGYAALISVLFAMGSGALVEAQARTVALDCPAGSTADERRLYPQICDALAREVRAALPGVSLKTGESGGGAVLTLNVRSLTDMALVGNLALRPADGGSTRSGPVVETSISDAKINERAVKDFARALVSVSKSIFD